MHNARIHDHDGFSVFRFECMYFTSEILCLFSLMHNPWMPTVEHTTALCMDCCNAVSHLFRTMHVNVCSQKNETYVAFDADDYPDWNSTHKHLIPVLENTF